MHAERTDLTNRQILERIIGDLNELIDTRGNTHLIPLLVAVKGAHDEVLDLQRVIASMHAAAEPEYDDDPLDWRD